MDNILIFNVDGRIHPVHGNLVRVKVFDDFMLFSPVMSFNFLFFDVLKPDEIGFISETSKDDLITTQMNDWIWEDVDDFGKYFPD